MHLVEYSIRCVRFHLQLHVFIAKHGGGRIILKGRPVTKMTQIHKNIKFQDLREKKCIKKSKQRTQLISPKTVSHMTDGL